MSETYTVPELTRRIGFAVTDAFREPIWVSGEISGLNRPRKHVYFELVAPRDDAGRVPNAVLPVVLFEANKEAVNRELKRHGVPRMADGVRVRIRGEVLFNERNGRVQLRMTGIDPAYTLGQIALDRDRVLRALRAEGLIDRNSRLPFPVVPLRVGLVTAAGSAAYNDFVHELTASGYGFHVHLVDARVQGAGAADDVVRALRHLAGLGLDVIALVRGGGSRADLVAFDGELLARTIALLPVPVLTGVGHEIDRSIADDVAHRAYKTPTACAAALVTAVRSFHEHTEALWEELAHAADLAVRRQAGVLDTRAGVAARAARASLRTAGTATDTVAARVARETVHTLGRVGYRLDRTSERTAAAARGHLTHRRALLDDAVRVLGSRPARELTVAERHLVQTEARVRALDPARLLARGWSITTTDDGALVRRVADAPPGRSLRTRVVDGVLVSTVDPPDETTPDG